MIATHDLDLVRELCPRVVVLRLGRAAADGAPRSVFADGDSLRRCGLEPPPSGLWPGPNQ